MNNTYFYLNNIQGLKHKVVSATQEEKYSLDSKPDMADAALSGIGVSGLVPVDKVEATKRMEEIEVIEKPVTFSGEHANNTQRICNDNPINPLREDPNISESWSGYRRGFEVIKHLAIDNWQLGAIGLTNLVVWGANSLSDFGPAIGGIARGLDATLFMHWIATKNAKRYVKGKLTIFNNSLRNELDRVYKIFVNAKDLNSSQKVQTINNMKLYFTVSSLLNGLEELRERIHTEREVINRTGIKDPAVLRDMLNYLDSGIMEITTLLSDVEAPDDIKKAVARLAAFKATKDDKWLVKSWLQEDVMIAIKSSSDKKIQQLIPFLGKIFENGSAAMKNKEELDKFLVAFDEFLHQHNSKFLSKIDSLQRRLLLTQVLQVVMGISLAGIIGVNSFTQDVHIYQKVLNFTFFLAPILYYAADGALNFYNQLRTFFDKNLPDYGDALQNPLDNPMMGSIRYAYAHNNIEWVFQDLISNVMMDGNFVPTENIFSEHSTLRRQSYGMLTLLNAAKARYELLRRKINHFLNGFSDDSKKMLPLLLSVDRYYPVPVEISIQRVVNNVLAGYEDNKSGYLTTFETLLLGFSQQDAGKHRTEQGRLLVEAVLNKINKDKNLALSQRELRLLVDKFSIADFNHYDFENMLTDALVNDLGWASNDARIANVVKQIVENKNEYQNQAVLAYAKKEGIPTQHAIAIMHQMQSVFQQESMFERISELANMLRKGILIDEEGEIVTQDVLRKELQVLLARAFYGTSEINDNIQNIVSALIDSGEEITQKSYDAFTLKDPMSDKDVSPKRFQELVNVRRRMAVMAHNEKKKRGEHFEANQTLTLFYSIRNMIAVRDSGDETGYEEKLKQLYFILTGNHLEIPASGDSNRGELKDEALKKIIDIYKDGILAKTFIDYDSDVEEHKKFFFDFDVTSTQAEQQIFDLVTRFNLLGIVDTARLELENSGLPGTAPGDRRSFTLALATRAAMLAGKAEADFYDDNSKINDVLTNSGRFGRYDAYFNMAFNTAQEGINQGLASDESLAMLRSRVASLKRVPRHVIGKAVDAFSGVYMDTQTKNTEIYLGMGSGLARDTRILQNFVESYREDSLGLRTHLDPKIEAVATANGELVAKGNELPATLKELIDLLYLNYMFQGDARGNIRLFGKTTGALTYEQFAEMVITSLENGQMDVRFRHAGRDFYIDLKGKDQDLLKKVLASGFLTAGQNEQQRIKTAVREYLIARKNQVSSLMELEEVVMNHEINGGNVLGDSRISLFNEPIFRLIYMKLAGVSYEQDVAPMDVKVVEKNDFSEIDGMSEKILGDNIFSSIKGMSDINSKAIREKLKELGVLDDNYVFINKGIVLKTKILEYSKYFEEIKDLFNEDITAEGAGKLSFKQSVEMKDIEALEKKLEKKIEKEFGEELKALFKILKDSHIESKLNDNFFIAIGVTDKRKYSDLKSGILEVLGNPEEARSKILREKLKIIGVLDKNYMVNINELNPENLELKLTDDFFENLGLPRVNNEYSKYRHEILDALDKAKAWLRNLDVAGVMLSEYQKYHNMEKLGSIPENAFSKIEGINEKQSKAIRERLKDSKILDNNYRIKKQVNLTDDKLELGLSDEYKNYRKEIINVLKLFPNKNILDAYDISTTTSPELEALRRRLAIIPAFVTGGKADQTNINSSHYGRGRIATQMRETRLYDYIAQRLQIVNSNNSIANIEIPPMILNKFEYEVTSNINRSQAEMMKNNAIYSTALQFMVKQLSDGKTAEQAGRALVKIWQDNLGLTDEDIIGGSLKSITKKCIRYAEILKWNMAIPNMVGGISAIYAKRQGADIANVNSAYSKYTEGLPAGITSGNVLEKIDEYIEKYIIDNKFSSSEAKELRNVAERMKRNILINDRINGFSKRLVTAREVSQAEFETVTNQIQDEASDDRFLSYYMKEVIKNISVGKGLEDNAWSILKGSWYTYPAQFLYRTPEDIHKEGLSARRLFDSLTLFRNSQTMYQSFLFARPMTMEEVNALNSSAQGQYVGLTKQVPEMENFRGIEIPVGSTLRTFADFFDKHVSDKANEIIAEYSKFQKMIREASSRITTTDTIEILLDTSLDQMAINNPDELIFMAKSISGDVSIVDAQAAKTALQAVFESREFTITFIQKRLDEVIAKALSTNNEEQYQPLRDYFDENVMPGSMYVLYEKLFGIRKARTHTNQDVDNYNFESHVNQPGHFRRVHYLNYDPVTGIFHKTRHGMIQGSQNLVEKSQPVNAPFSNLDQVWNEVLLKFKGYIGGLYANGCFFIQRLDTMMKSQMYWQDIEQDNATMTSDSRISRLYESNKKFWTEIKSDRPIIYHILRTTLVGSSFAFIPFVFGVSATVSSVAALSGMVVMSYLALTLTSSEVVNEKDADKINKENKKNFMFYLLFSGFGASTVFAVMTALNALQPMLNSMGMYAHQFSEIGVVASAALIAAGLTTWVTQHGLFTKIREKVVINELGRSIKELNVKLESLVSSGIIDVDSLTNQQKSEMQEFLKIYANCKVDRNYVNRNQFFAGYINFFNDLFDDKTTDTQKKKAFAVITQSDGKIKEKELTDIMGLEEASAQDLLAKLRRLNLIHENGELTDDSVSSSEIQHYLRNNFSSEQKAEINLYFNVNYYKSLMLKTDSNDFVKQIYDKLNKLASDSDNKQKYETMLNDFCKMMGIKRADLDKLFSPESKAQSEEKEKIAKEIQKRFYEIYSTKDKGVPGDVPIACQKFISRFEDYKTTSATEDAFSWITNYFMGWTTQSMPGGMPIGMAGANTSFDVVVPQRGGRWYSSTSAFLTYALLNDVYQNWQTRPAGTAVGTLSTLFYGYSGIAKMQLLIGVPLVAFGFINPFFFLTAAGLTAFSLFSFANYSSAMQSNRIARVRMGAQSYGVDLALYAENKIHMPTALKETISRGGIKPEQTIQIMNMSIGDMLRRPFDLYTWITVFDKLTNPISSPLHSAGFNITVEMAGSTQPKFTPSLHTFISAGYSLVSAVLFLKMMDAVSMGNYMEVPYSFVFLLWSYFQLKIAIGTEQMSRLGANFIKDGEVVRTGKFLQGAVENESDYRKDIKETLFD